jgi:hypothetical protein
MNRKLTYFGASPATFIALCLMVMFSVSAVAKDKLPETSHDGLKLQKDTKAAGNHGIAHSILFVGGGISTARPCAWLSVHGRPQSRSVSSCSHIVCAPRRILAVGLCI